MLPDSIVHAAVDPVNIIPRSAWLKSCPTTKTTNNLEYYKIEKIVIHHTAGGTNTTLEQGKAIVDAICDYHVNKRGFDDIGYNYLIDPLGNIYEGRYGGEGSKGYHANHANPGSIGISLIGDYSSRDIPVKMKESLIRLLADLSQRYQINPAGSGVLQTSCYSFNKPNIASHRDYVYLGQSGTCEDTSTWYNRTACPGEAFYRTLGTIRQAVANQNITIPPNGVFLAEYYANRFLQDKPLQTLTQGQNGNISFDWGERAPLAGFPGDNFSVRWRGMIDIPSTGIYTFSLGSDDGSRLYVDNQLVINQWQDQGYTVKGTDVGLTKGKHQVRVEYYEKTGLARVSVAWKAKTLPANTFLGEYFGNAVFEGAPLLVRQDDAINFNWKTGTPDKKLGTNYYAIRWTGTLNITQTNNYLFTLGSDDKSRLYVGDMNTPLINAWQNQAFTNYSAIKGLSKGNYQVKIEYVEDAGDAAVALSWAPASAAAFSSPGGIEVKTSKGTTLLSAPANQSVNLAYSDQANRYYINSGDQIASTQDYLILTPKGGTPPYISYDNYTGTYKQFRGRFIVRASSATQKLNIINELNIEDYLKGLGETGQNSNLEYTKALITAARTYALYHLQAGGKHAEDYYDLNNTSSDQVYLGYGYEQTGGDKPALTQAVNATKGKVITHDQSTLPNKLIVATYYSQTGAIAQTCGREKGTERCTWNVASWPWIPENGVPDPWWMKNNVCYNADNEGRTGAGHGYGLSGRGAFCFATQDSRSYDWILKYYYNNIKISDYPTDTSKLTIKIGINPIPFADISSEKYPDGMLIKSANRSSVYILQNGKKRLFRTGEIFLSHGFDWSQIVVIPDSDVKSFPTGTQMTHNDNLLADGSLIRVQNSPAIYQVEAKYRRVFPDAETYLSHYSSWSNIKTISLADMNKYADGSKMTYVFTPLANGTLVKASSPAVYLIDKGVLRHFTSVDIFLANGYNFSQVVTVSDLHLSKYEKGANVQLQFTPQPNGTLLKTDSAPDVFLIQDGKKRAILCGEIFINQNYQWSNIKTVHPLHLEQYPKGTPVLFKNGSLINAAGQPEVYLIENGKRRHIQSGEDFLALGYSWDMLITTSSAAINAHPKGSVLVYVFVSRPDDSLIKTSTPQIYQIQNGKKRLFPNAEVFLSYGYKWSKVAKISDLEMTNYPRGTEMKFKDGTLVQASGPKVYLIEKGYKRHIPSLQIFQSHSFVWNDVITTSNAYLATYPDGVPLAPYTAPVPGNLDDVTDQTAN